MSALWGVRLVESRWVPDGQTLMVGNEMHVSPRTMWRLTFRYGADRDAEWTRDWYRDPASAWWEQ
jgi:hypothetical protein